MMHSPTPWIRQQVISTVQKMGSIGNPFLPSCILSFDMRMASLKY
jgi:hypothetical protein